MIEQLTRSERQNALALLLAVFCAGLLLLGIGKDDVLGAHGLLVMAAAVLGVFGVLSGYFALEPSDDRFDRYYDEPSKLGILLAMVWAAFSLFIGDWVAWLLAYPDMTFDYAWSSFGRLRPVHTTGIIFGFGGNALIATSFYVMQRTSRARMPDQLSPLFVIFGYNLFCVLAVSGYLMGITQSKEYAEPEWYADIWLVVVWVTYFVVYLRTLAHRKEPHIYVANWYYMAFILVVALLHIVNNLAVPVWGSAKSYSLFSGVQDAMMQWWYGHNAVAFFLTAGSKHEKTRHWSGAPPAKDRSPHSAATGSFARCAANFAWARARRSSNLASRRGGWRCTTLSASPGLFCEPAQPWAAMSKMMPLRSRCLIS
jgi:cytochrome c oxidase cbb3-type subunit 1